MSIEFYLEKMKDIQKKTIIYLENDSDSDLFEILNDYKIKESKHELGSFLHLLSKLSNNFHRVPLIYSKIEKILHFLQVLRICLPCGHETAANGQEKRARRPLFQKQAAVP